MSGITPKDRSLVALDSSYREVRTHEERGRPADLISRMYYAVGATEGCDLLLLLVRNNAKGSQPRCTRQRLPGNAHA
ncbi:hypothetical protein EMIT0196MI5_100075 [Pseudomonas sp. IT-196MI5]